MPTSLTDLPNEVIFQILLHVPPSSAHTLQHICRRFNDLTQPLLWKYHCRTQFSYWSQGHCIQEKFADKAAKIDWKKIFSDRQIVDQCTNQEINDILTSQQGRIEKSEKIVDLGYDTKDELLRNLHVNDEAPDVLARQYYSNAVLLYLHRTMAIQEWIKIKNGKQVSLERALGAFDMFVLHERNGDFNDVSRQLDKIAESISIEIPNIIQYNSRQKATAIASYLRKENLTGLKDGDDYRDLQNNFIGIALMDKNHPSLPIISVAIYCCVARRLGLDASLCGFPFHVLAIIKSTVLDGRADRGTSDTVPMYMDPFQSDHELLVEDLQSQLLTMGVAISDHEALLDAASTVDIVRRTAWNIIASVQTIPRNRSDHMRPNSSFPDIESSFYGALWALTLLPDDNPMAPNVQQTRYLPYIMNHLEKHFSLDLRLIEDYILPLSQNLAHYEQLRDTIEEMRTSDTMRKPVKRRIPETSRNVRYRIGQVFRHKRYNYQAVITGWDIECVATENWISQMGIDNLARGRQQSFYQVLVEDGSVRYVAEENIEVVQRQINHNLMNLAGRHFKRWDVATKAFISNIKDEYPDD